MSVLAVASMLEGDYAYRIVDGNLEDDPVGRIVALHEATPLTAIGVTVMPGPQLEQAAPDCRRLKAALPGVPVVWGGYFPSQHAEVCLREPYVDFCVSRQGEITFRELVDVLVRGGALSGVLGLSYEENGTVRHNPQRPLVPLDDLPDWPYESVTMERYFHRHYLGDRVGTHHSSYGCPFACNFCAVVGMSNRRWLPQSPERVARILAHQRERWGADAVQFHDMDFFVSERRTAEIAERIRPLDLGWWALGRVDELLEYADSTWAAMKASGLKMVFCGAESGSAEVLEQMNKGGTASPDRTLELAARMRSWGIVPEFSFVVGNPPDPERDVHDTIAFIRRLKRINPATEIILYMYTPVPLDGTLYDQARALGFRFPDTLDAWVDRDFASFSLRRDPHAPWIDPALRRHLHAFESVLNAYYPTVTDTRLRGLKRTVLRAMGGWRYRLGVYAAPVELQLFHRFVGYRRPETMGF
jgi:radical SAM superfamily enzyme YgiQ (UPF0313 family)